MSNYSISDIENLIKRCNKSNKKIIISTIKEIIEEDDSLNVKLLNIENINNNFFKNLSIKNNKSSFCTICQDKIKSKEHKIKLPDCDHIFHKKCLNKYMKSCLINFSCPNCKNDYKMNLENIATKISSPSINTSQNSCYI
jgi:hypothetical protein